MGMVNVAPFRGSNRGRPDSQDEIHLEGDQVGGESGQALASILREAILYAQVLSFHIPEGSQALADDPDRFG